MEFTVDKLNNPNKIFATVRGNSTLIAQATTEIAPTGRKCAWLQMFRPYTSYTIHAKKALKYAYGGEIAVDVDTIPLAAPTLVDIIKKCLGPAEMEWIAADREEAAISSVAPFSGAASSMKEWKLRATAVSYLLEAAYALATEEENQFAQADNANSAVRALFSHIREAR